MGLPIEGKEVAGAPKTIHKEVEDSGLPSRKGIK
jgi:hypothetical protein